MSDADTIRASEVAALDPVATLTEIRESLLAIARAYRTVIPPAELTAMECNRLAARVGRLRDSLVEAAEAETPSP